MTRGLVFSIMFAGFVLCGIYAVIYIIFDFGKRSASKDGRKEIAQNAKVLVNDFKSPEFHKTMRDGFKWEIRFFLFLAAVLLIGAVFGTL